MRSMLNLPVAAENSDRPYTDAWYGERVALLGHNACKQLGFYVLPDEFLLSVVVPVYNEEATIGEIVDAIRAIGIRKEIILVDDCSRDGSKLVLDNLASHYCNDPENRLIVAAHDRNRGKGAALRTGFGLSQGNVVLIQDADLEYDPGEYPRLLQPIIEGRADVVYGSRFLGDRSHRVLYFWHYVGNKILTALSNCFTNLNLTDMETCYKVFTRDALADILPTLRQDRFGFEPEITAKVARRRLRVYELAISYSGRTYEEGKKIGWRDGLHALWCIVRYAYRD